MDITVLKTNRTIRNYSARSLSEIMLNIFPEACSLESLEVPSEENWIPVDDLDATLFENISFRDVINEEDINAAKDGFAKVVFCLIHEGDDYFLNVNNFKAIAFNLKTAISESTQGSDDLFNIVSGGLPQLYFSIAETIFGCIHGVRVFLEEVVDVVLKNSDETFDKEREFLYRFYESQSEFFDREKKWKWDKMYSRDNYWNVHERAKRIKEWHNSTHRNNIIFPTTERYHDVFVKKVYQDFKGQEKTYQEKASEYNNNNKNTTKTTPEYQFVYMDTGMNSKIMNAWYVNDEGWNIEFSNFSDFVIYEQDEINRMCGNQKNQGKDPYLIINKRCKEIQEYRNRTSHNIKAQAEEGESSFKQLFLHLSSLVKDLSFSKDVNGDNLLAVLEKRQNIIMDLLEKRKEWYKWYKMNLTNN